jgi:hypothetical protein
MTEAIRSSKTSVLTRATRGNIPQDGILHSQSHENPKSYTLRLCSSHNMRPSFTPIPEFIFNVRLLKLVVLQLTSFMTVFYLRGHVCV